jgi:uncharacterized protein (DUF1501 family)
VLTGGTVAVVGPAPFGPLPLEAVLGNSASEVDKRCVVLIQLTGGNDVLNTLIPYEDPDYHRSRPTLRTVAGKAHRINDHLALHPALASVKELLDRGKLGIIQGVGYPNSSRDHDQALQDWQTGLPGETMERSGWIGRVADELMTEPLCFAPALFVGTLRTPLALMGRRCIVPRVTEPGSLVQGLDKLDSSGTGEEAAGTSPAAVQAGSSQGVTEFLRLTAWAAESLARRIHRVLESRGPAGDDSRFELERRLGVMASLIEADVGIRFFYTDFGGAPPGGFDTHANQLENHHALLRELGQSILTFINRLERIGRDRDVLLLTFSEFGRTLAENGRHGTDHGAAGAMFAVGGGVRAGVLGSYPDLRDLDQGGLKVHTDYRAVYKTVLERWLGISSLPAFGQTSFQAVDFLRPEVVVKVSI